jgi:hypothetical protein
MLQIRGHEHDDVDERVREEVHDAAHGQRRADEAINAKLRPNDASAEYVEAIQ